MQRILVTGGCGFIGVNLCLHLLDHDYSLTVYDNFSQRDGSVLTRACQNHDLPIPEMIEADVSDQSLLNKALEGSDGVVHLAAFTNVRESTRNPMNDLKINSRGTANVLEATRHSSTTTNFVLASSNAAVGEVEGPVDETRVPEPLSPYGANKLHGEALARVYSECYDLSTTSLRFANAYGPYASHKTSVIPKFLRRAKQGKPLKIYGDGKQTRDFIHARDIASAIRLVLENPETDGEVYQVAQGKETEINDLARRIREIAKDDGMDVEIVHTDARIGEIKFNYSSIEKIQNELSWTPERELETELKNLYEGNPDEQDLDFKRST